MPQSAYVCGGVRATRVNSCTGNRGGGRQDAEGRLGGRYLCIEVLEVELARHVAARHPRRRAVCTPQQRSERCAREVAGKGRGRTESDLETHAVDLCDQGLDASIRAAEVWAGDDLLRCVVPRLLLPALVLPRPEQ